jgi:hypothetical protein
MFRVEMPIASWRMIVVSEMYSYACVASAESAQGITIRRAYEDVSSHIGSGYVLRKLLARMDDGTCHTKRG